ncbi:MAG: hypothetical protein AB1750_01835 [Chloroflexota bacterium]
MDKSNTVQNLSSGTVSEDDISQTKKQKRREYLRLLIALFFGIGFVAVVVFWMISPWYGREIVCMEDAIHAAFSPDGKYVVSGSGDDTLRVWDASTGDEISYMPNIGYTISVSFSPTGKEVLTASTDDTARIWDVNTGKEIARMPYHDRTGRTFGDTALFSSDGRYVASISDFDTVSFTEIVSGKKFLQITHEGSVISSIGTIGFSSDGKYLVSGGDFTARVWEVATGQEIARMTHDHPVRSVKFSLAVCRRRKW